MWINGSLGKRIAPLLKEKFKSQEIVVMMLDIELEAEGEIEFECA